MFAVVELVVSEDVESFLDNNTTLDDLARPSKQQHPQRSEQQRSEQQDRVKLCHFVTAWVVVTALLYAGGWG